MRGQPCRAGRVVVVLGTVEVVVLGWVLAPAVEAWGLALFGAAEDPRDLTVGPPAERWRDVAAPPTTAGTAVGVVE